MKINTLPALFAVSLNAAGAFAQSVPKPTVAPVDPKVAECRATNQAERKSIVEMNQKANTGGKIDSKEAQAFGAMQAKMN